MPELTQAIFAITTTKLPTSTNITTTPMKQKKINALTQQQELEQQQKTEHQQPQPQLLSPTQHVRNELAEKIGTSMNLPSVYGLKIRAINTAAPQQHQQQQQMSHVVANNNNSNSLLKQQLRAGLKDIDIAKVDNATNMDSNKTQQFGESSNSNNNVNDSGNGKFSNDTNKNNNVSNCCALQSLANVAERQMPNVIQQSTNVNSLHHQLLLHMAAQTNPLLKTSADFFQLQQQQQQQQQPQLSVAALAASTPTQSTAHCIDDDMDLLIEPNDKYEPEHDLTLADENAGFEYRQCSEMENDQQQQMQQTIGAIAVKTTTSSSRPVQRRRVRRKAQSTNDDQAEHLTEMSVRGLDLFRYASISEGVYQCTECAKENMQKTFKNKYSFQRHAFLYHEGKHRKVFPCPVCSKEFSRPDKMKNHMKMTHENFLATTKDISNFNPLNYLITATATGDIQATLYQQQQQQQQQNQSSYDLQRAANEHQFQLEQNIKKLEHHQHQQQQQQQQQQQPHSSQQVQQQQLENNAILLDREVKQEIETSPTVENSPLSPPDATVSMLKMENNIIVKNELVISPSPTPPPFSLATTDGSQSSGSGATGNITLTATAQTAT